MKKPTDDIFEHIKSILQNYEEPYQKGSWERFVRTHHPKKWSLTIVSKWALTAAAAVAGIVMLTHFFNNQRNASLSPAVPQITTAKNTDTTANNVHTAVTPVPPIPNKVTGNKSNSHTSTASVMNTKKADAKTTFAIPLPVTSSADTPAQQPIAENKTVVVPPTVDFWKSKPESPQVVTTPSVDIDDKTTLATTTLPSIKKQKEKTKKWHPGIYLSPTFGNLGVEMGYGISLSYAVSNKIKISSGIAHSKISASRSFDRPIAPTMQADIVAEAPNEAKSLSNTIAYTPQQNNYLQQINGYLSGIDVPLEVSYSFNKKLYASTGVSGLFVINDRKQYTYLNSRNEKVTVESDKDGTKENKLVQFNVKNTTNEPVQNTNDNIPFLGFYNLSVGFKQNVLGKSAVSIEPFIKVPLQSVTSQKLNYSGVGIKLKFDF